VAEAARIANRLHAIVDDERAKGPDSVNRVLNALGTIASFVLLHYCGADRRASCRVRRPSLDTQKSRQSVRGPSSVWVGWLIALLAMA
jgi:hypothetical protein